MKIPRWGLSAVFGAVAAILVGFTIERDQIETLTHWMFERRSDDSYSWVLWMAAGAVLGGVGHTLINSDDKQP